MFWVCYKTTHKSEFESPGLICGELELKKNCHVKKKRNYPQILGKENFSWIFCNSLESVHEVVILLLTWNIPFKTRELWPWTMSALLKTIYIFLFNFCCPVRYYASFLKSSCHFVNFIEITLFADDISTGLLNRWLGFWSGGLFSVTHLQ